MFDEYVRYPETVVQLTGTDGNAFAVMGAVTVALKKAYATDAEIAEYQTEALSGDYNNLLEVSASWVQIA